MRFLKIALAALLFATPSVSHAQGFGIFFGDEPSDLHRRDPRLPMCMTDRQIRNAIADLGYQDIALNVQHEDNIQVRATRGGAIYLIDFNACTGEIEGRQRLR